MQCVPAVQVIAVLLLAGGAASAREPIVGLPCEGCEAVFEDLPAKFASASRIASPDEPGIPMIIEGHVRDRQGRAAAGVIVYAYHTNARGIYPTDERKRGQASFRHGMLRAWVRTDSEGRYRFDTIRPGGYPNTDIPAHVHVQVLEPGRCAYYLDDLMFTDDPRLTPAQRAHLVHGRGGNGIVTPRRDASGTLRVTRDIVLGENIPGYEECGA
jgi:protocatechuate 3,4-dioxygenase beta subunit